jgi:hypothetical protein
MTMHKEAVTCHLCGNVIEGLLAEQPDDSTDFFYYCEECSEMAIDVQCSECEKIFQDMPGKDEADDVDVEIEYLCDNCCKSKFGVIDINNMEFDPREITCVPSS